MGVAFRLTRQDMAFSGAIFLTTNALERTPNLAELGATADGQASPYTYQVFGLMSNELNTPKLLVCPNDERRFHTNFNIFLNNNGNDPRQLVNQFVSYFVGKEIDEASSRMLEFGDRNIGTSDSGPNSVFGFSKLPNDNSGYAKVFGTNALNGAAQWTRKMHNQFGNILFADGHVEKLDSKMLRKAFENSGDRYGTATSGNFLLFP